jgi:imidazolonepropionase-like amidohydrolase
MPSGVRLRSTSGAGAEWPETLVDGPDEVRKAVRPLLRAGADFIKLHASGGVLSPTDEPTDTGFSPEEIAIMVYEAKARGKTCIAHAQGDARDKECRQGRRRIDRARDLLGR